MRTPLTLPVVPTEDELRAVLKACKGLPSELRNRALILVLADCGLRAREVCRLLVEDWHRTERVVFVRGGKGRKDRVVPFSPTTARAIKAYLATRRNLAPEDFLFVGTKQSEGKPLTQRNLDRILERLSARAGLPEEHYLYPHALRHFAATSWLRAGMGLDEVRRLLGHTTLSTTLIYSQLVSADLQRAHRAAGALERMHLQ